MLVGLHVPTNFQMYRQSSEKAKPPSGYANGCIFMAMPRKPIYDLGNLSREARGKFIDLVCLVVFLCWIESFVLLPLCLNANIWIYIFQAFKNRGGDDPPQKYSRGGGGTRPPRPPRDRPPMPWSHLHVKPPRKSHVRRFHEMEWDLATSWQFRALYVAITESMWLLRGCTLCTNFQ